MLQDLCGSRMLVDKMPANADHPMILRRAQESSPHRFICIFDLVRHPYAAISSGVQLTRDSILGQLDVTWSTVEQACVCDSTVYLWQPETTLNSEAVELEVCSEVSSLIVETWTTWQVHVHIADF